MHTKFEQNKAFSRQLDEHSFILQNISKQLESLNSDISNLQTRLTTTETYVSNMSHTQDTLINQMAAKPEVIPKEEDRIKSLPTHHTIATIQVVEDIKTLCTHHIPSPPGPINGDATTSTVEEETPMNIEAFKQVSLNDITTTLIDVVTLILIIAPYLNLLVSCTKCLETPTLAHLILPSQSISPMVSLKLGRRSLE